MPKRARNPQKLDNESITKGGRLGLFLEDERDRVDTPALIGGYVEPLTLKDMAQVRIACGAADLGPDAWGKGAIFNQGHCIV